MNSSAEAKALQKASLFLTGADREFFLRVWSSPLSIYANRLKKIGFSGYEKVLDAGCGMGQWSVNLAKLNRSVESIDYAGNRVLASRSIASAYGISNARFSRQSVEKLKFKSESFDAIFCYGVIFLTDFRKALSEFMRVLKPGGTLYFSANGIGWFGFLIATEHNKSKNYDPRRIALRSIEESLLYFSGIKYKRQAQLVIPQKIVRKELQRIGFSKIRMAPDGQLGLKSKANLSFYPDHYENEEFVYEVLCQKKK